MLSYSTFLLVYVDTDRVGCTDLNFQFGNTGVGTALANRGWSIKVTQFSCNYRNRAPRGCTQYFFGPATSTVETYNYQNGAGQQLANQDQQICIRRERGFCRICYYAIQLTDFAVSGPTATKSGYNKGSVCCGGSTSETKGIDCVQIRGAIKESVTMTGAGVAVKSNICGRSAGLVTTTGMVGKSICSTLTPFTLAFRSDAFEYLAESMNGDRGFRLGYTMDNTRCTQNTNNG